MNGSDHNAASPGGSDPSMDDILASIRRILAEDEPPKPGSPEPNHASPNHSSPVQPMPSIPLVGSGSDVLDLDSSMMIEDAPYSPPPVSPPMSASHAEPAIQPVAPEPVTAAMPLPEPAPPRVVPETLVAPEAAAAATASVGNLMRHLAAERNLQVSRSGPSLEDVIRDEIRPLLKSWLDTNLPGMVERLVRAEITRVVDRSID